MGVHSGIGPEPPGYFLPYAQDNTTPLDDTKLIKIIPHNGCDSATKLIVGIRSAPTEFDRRKWVRQTWAKVRSKAIKVIFVIANHKENDINFQVRTERKFYDDILLLDYDDSYYNMSLKNYGYYEYVLKNCPNADCVLKVDSDTEPPGYFLPYAQDNTMPLDDTNLIKIIPHNGCDSATKLIVGIRSPVVRDTNSKWYVPRYVYDKKFYPLYPNGFAQFITGRGTLQKLQDTLRTRTPFLVSENFRRLPDDAIYQGDVVELAGIQLQDNGRVDRPHRPSIGYATACT
uniref:Hexosyltransferase n=1 Tax=Acrobeloides nanus TaxID=290746 RepID=A0A914DMF6_9BILA